MPRLCSIFVLWHLEGEDVCGAVLPPPLEVELGDVGVVAQHHRQLHRRCRGVGDRVWWGRWA